MSIENIITVKIDLSNAYTIKYNLILLENSKITTQGLIGLFESFYGQCPESYTFIFDFSNDIDNVVDFTPVRDYLDTCGYPEWSCRTLNPVRLGKTDSPTSTTQRLAICSDIVQKLFGNYGICKIENVYCDIQEE